MFDDVREYHQVEQQHTKETMQFKDVVGEYRKICFPYEAELYMRGRLRPVFLMFEKQGGAFCTLQGYCTSAPTGFGTMTIWDLTKTSDAGYRLVLYMICFLALID